MANDDDDVSPWARGTGVKGIVPPGRRLSKDSRPTRWSASGVRGVRPPGNAKPGEIPAWAKTKDQRAADARRLKAQRKRGDGTSNPNRPTAGPQPDVSMPIEEPREFRKFLAGIETFLKDFPLPEDAAQDFAIAIRQSHAPYQIIIGFTGLSFLVGSDTRKRRTFSHALERGAVCYFNLAQRLDETINVPRGLRLQTVDPIFWDLPPSAIQLPYAWATDALCQLLFLFRHEDNEDADEALMKLVRDKRRQHLEGRVYGDRDLVELFPWEEPEWAPPPEED